MPNIFVAYDVVNDKRRNKIARFLEEYGFRINKSVFIFNGAKKTVQLLQQGIAQWVKKGDVIIIFPLCNKCYGKSVILGAPPLTKRQGATKMIE